MTQATGAKPIVEGKPPDREKKERKTRSGGPKIPENGVDPEARRLCVVILEVLAGARTPTDAAGTLGVSPPRYYALESRALGGLLEACRRRSKGPRRTPERDNVRLRREVDRLTRECARTQALLRSAQRAMGISAPAAQPKKPEVGSKKRKRRPVVRALRAAKVLRSEPRIPVEPRAQKPDDAPALVT